MAPNTRRDRERQRHRQEILEAASRLIAERGPDALTMDEVARRAEFAVGSLYRHFTSKEALIEALVLDQLVPMFTEAEGLADAEGRFEDLFDRMLKMWMDTSRRAAPALRLMIAATVDFSKQPQLLVAVAGFHSSIRALVERGQADGAIIGEDPDLITAAIVGMLEAYSKRLILGLPVDLEGGMRVVRRAVLEGFRAPLNGESR